MTPQPRNGKFEWVQFFTAKRLLIGFALLHITLAIALHVAGRTGVMPSLVDADGIVGSFAYDSYEYQKDAFALMAAIHDKGVAAAAIEPQPVHVRLMTISMMGLGPAVGYGPLAAEPFNLLCYLAILCFAYLLAREIGGESAGILGMALAGSLPSLVLHTLQLLKDGMFIAFALAFIFCATALLTRVFTPRTAAIGAGSAAIAIWLLTQTRSQFIGVIVAIALSAGIVLVAQKLGGRNDLNWNFACTAMIIAACALTAAVRGPHVFVVEKLADPPDGPAKLVEGPKKLPSVVTYLPRTAAPDTLGDAADRVAVRIGSVRSRFAASYANAGSNVDPDVDFHDSEGMLRFVPRAFVIGVWAPFPDSWMGGGRRVNSAGKTLSGIETLAMYVLEIFAIVGIAIGAQRLPALFLISVALMGMMFLGLVVNNVAALYRFRYTFWIVLIVLAAKGLIDMKPRAFIRLPLLLRTASIGALLMSAAISFGCSSPSSTAGIDRAITIVNYTGSGLRSVYLSQSSTQNWQENLLSVPLQDGDTLKVELGPLEAPVWDLRVEDSNGKYAEWTQLRLHSASRITLKVVPGPSRPNAAAEVE